MYRSTVLSELSKLEVKRIELKCFYFGIVEAARPHNLFASFV